MPTYLAFTAADEPSQFAQDALGRPMWVFNVEARVAASTAAFAEEIGARLVAQGACTAFGTDMFAGRDVKIPAGPGPFVLINPTGGRPPERIHNADAAHIRNLTAQITVYAEKYKTGRTRAFACFDALDGIFNTALSA